MHRDLAARNILVAEDKTCKVCVVVGCHVECETLFCIVLVNMLIDYFQLY